MSLNRRELLVCGASATAVLVSGVVRGQAAAQPRVRKNVSTLAPNAPEILQYASAVNIMRQLPPADRRSWQRQAEIHQQFCPHDNWWFLPWHRAYLWYFEQCCRDVLQSDSFALPYWNWTKNPKIPAPFWSGSLNHDRAASPNTDMSSEYVGAQVISDLMGSSALTNIYSSATTDDNQRAHMSAGGVESRPHNHVHGRIGHDMGTYLSPLDPIFWLHHANIDRIWRSWSHANSNRSPSADLWRDHELAEFFDPSTKASASPKASDMLQADTWGARYDEYEVAANPVLTTSRFVVATGALALAGDGDFHLSQASATFPDQGVAIGGTMRAAIAQTPRLRTILASVPKPIVNAPRPEVYLALEGVPKPKSENAGLRVFLNCKDPGTNTPIGDPSYVGSIAFFNAQHHDAEMNFVLDVSKTLTNLASVGAYTPDSPLDVALVAIDTTAPDSKSGEVLRAARARILAAG